MLHSCHCTSEEMYSSITSVLLQSLPRFVKPTNAACPVLVTNSKAHRSRSSFGTYFQLSYCLFQALHLIGITLLVILSLLIWIVDMCDLLENLPTCIHLTETYLSSQQVQRTSASITSEKTASSELARIVLALVQVCFPSQKHLQTP